MGWSDGWANWRLRSGKRRTCDRIDQTRLHTEGQWQAQATGHLNLAGSGLHDSNAMLVLEPIFEADLPSELYAYRPGRNAQQAVVAVGELLFRGHPEVVDADLADYFGEYSPCRTF